MVNNATGKTLIDALADDDRIFVDDTSASGATKSFTPAQMATYVNAVAGDVVGPASSTDNAVARYDSTTGKLLQNSGVTIDDSGNIATAGTVDGRDVSTDGTKLDTIETSADVTDATNVAAAGGLIDTNNLSDVSNASTSRTNLGVAIGSDVQAYDAALDNVSGTNTGDQTITLTGDVTGTGTGSFAATIAADSVTYDKMQDTSGTDVVLGRSTASGGTVEEIACTAAGRALIDDASASAQRTTMGVAIGSDVQAYDAALDNVSGTNTGDQSLFETISVSGQSDVVADTTTDTLTFVAGSNMTITTNAGTDTITFAATGGFFNLGSPTELTIASGAITATQSNHTVDTESDAASDDLDTINGGTEGDILVLRAISGARTVVVKTGTGNIRCGLDVSLDSALDTVTLVYASGLWAKLAVANNGV